MTEQENSFATASFTPQSGPNKGKKFPVLFNPASLDYTVSNTMEQQDQGNSNKQYVSQSSAKLSMELIFDTTDSGNNVRQHTDPFAHFMEPHGLKPKEKAPPVLLFEWGVYTFQGMMESYKETLDFFAPTGVPLRATVSISLAAQDKVFEDTTEKPEFDKEQEQEKPSFQTPSNQSPTDVAGAGGDPRAARNIGAANGAASLRFSAGASLTVDASIELGGPVAFASGGAGIGIGGGAGIGIGGGVGLDIGGGAGIGIGGGAGVSAGASAGAGGGFSLSAGSSASAGVSAAAGAFSGLKTSKSIKKSASFNTDNLLPPNPVAGLSTDAGASFGLGGEATLKGSASLSADVGAEASLKGKLEFD